MNISEKQLSEIVRITNALTTYLILRRTTILQQGGPLPARFDAYQRALHTLHVEGKLEEALDAALDVEPRDKADRLDKENLLAWKKTVSNLFECIAWSGWH